MGTKVSRNLIESPSGLDVAATAMLFHQTAAPALWTKDVTHNNKSLRIVSGSISSGGATAFTSVFGSGKVTGSRTLSEAQTAVHDHPDRKSVV